MPPPLPNTLALGLRLEHLDWPQALGLFALLAVPVIALGVRSLAGLGPTRRWVALGARLTVLAVLVLVLAGLRVERENEVVEVMVLRDLSDSARQAVDENAGQTLAGRVTQWLQSAVGPGSEKEPDDRVGVISFDAEAYVDQMPNALAQTLASQGTAVDRGTPGTDPAAAVQLAMATGNRDARKRILLIWDGNQTEGDLDQAVELARKAGVPIDVMPLAYEVGDEVLVERFVAPTWQREGEPFSLEVILTNTAAFNARGTLRVEQEGRPLDLDPTEPGVQSGRAVTLAPGRNKEVVLVDPLADEQVNVRRFRAVFEPERETTARGTRNVGDGLLANNAANAFTFVSGKGRVLYVDNTGLTGGGGEMLARALNEEGIEIDESRTSVDRFPTSLIDLQGYDAIVLNNVPRGAGGLSDPQQVALAQYVHDTGGGLVMVGGPNTLGAGGWQGSRLEEILPVDMDVPQKRQIPKGALNLVMHSTEMAQGNYWAEQCAIKAVEVLNRQDHIGVLSYDFSTGGAQWDYPLGDKGNGSRVYAAIKNMVLGDMPDFDDALDLSLYGDADSIGLIDSDARQKHVIIISDMDPSPPSDALLQAYVDNRISISTVQVAGHGQPLMPVAKTLAEATGGTAYGPIEDNPGQLPQIFIKEATIVRRSLIKEDSGGIPVGRTLDASGSEFMKNVGDVPPLYGYILTSKKPSPLVEVPLVAGEERDPIFAHWQTGLGKAAVWTSDAHNRWAANFAGAEQYRKFFAQVVRGVSRAPQSADYEVRTVVEDGRGRVIVEAVGEDAKFKSSLAIRGSVLKPDDDGGEPLNLVQVKPGVYEAGFDARREGNYVVALQAADPEGGAAALRGGTAVNGSAELLDLRSDEAAVRRVAEATGGRVLPAFGAADGPNALFARSWTDLAGNGRTLPVSRSPLPIWDWLIPILLALILIDVAIRRIAWDWDATRAFAAAAGGRVRGFTQTTREDRQSAGTLGALRGTRDAVAAGVRQGPAVDRSAKFDAGDAAVEGDLSSVVGGASDKPVPKGRPDAKPKGLQGERPSEGGGMSSLMEAKRRARERMKDEQ